MRVCVCPCGCAALARTHVRVSVGGGRRPTLDPWYCSPSPVLQYATTHLVSLTRMTTSNTIYQHTKAKSTRHLRCWRWTSSVLCPERCRAPTTGCLPAVALVAITTVRTAARTARLSVEGRYRAYHAYQRRSRGAEEQVLRCHLPCSIANGLPLAPRRSHALHRFGPADSAAHLRLGIERAYLAAFFCICEQVQQLCA